MSTENILVISTTGDEKQGEGSIEVHTYSKNEKIFNAFKKVGLFWGLSFICLFFPGLHFILTPLFFILGIYFGFKTFAINFNVLSGEVTCSQCQKPVKISAGLLEWPLTEICQSCVNTLRIHKKKGA